jgi:hypothetical protein
LTVDLSINGCRARIATTAHLRNELAAFAGEEFREIWLNVEDGPALCALFNGGMGWLMYLRKSGDAGFSSRNPGYRGDADAVRRYRLSNGQDDTYPASWALPEVEIIRALEHFVECQQPAPFIQWHDDGA